MSHIEADVAQRMAYKDMNLALYLSISLIFYAVIVLLSILLKDISVVFDFVSALGISGLAFFIPGIFYKRAVEKFSVKQTPAVVSRLRISTLFYVLGVLNFILGISSGVITLVGV